MNNEPNTPQEPIDATQPIDSPTSEFTTEHNRLDTAAPHPKRRVRWSTVVWGLIIIFLGVCLLIPALGYALDFQLVLIIALAAIGLTLVVGAISKTVRG